MLFKLILEGILYGLFLSILVGPLLVTLVDTSIKNGIKNGLLVAAGIWLSDILFIVAVAYLSLKFEDVISSRFINHGSWITALIFIGVGFKYLITKESHTHESKWKLPTSGFWQFWKGFLVNTINPFTLVFWTSLAANQVILKDQSTTNIMVFFLSILFVIIITDTLKVFIANRIHYFLHSKTINYLRLFSGVVFILSGGYILYKFGI
jgi:threonine/homoserine/homoserine lactone efflux protein